MNINYLKDRFEHAQSMNADIVKIDIEEFASLLKWIDEEHNIGKKAMTREELIKAIYKDMELCPDRPCDLPEKEGNTGDCCCKCAERQLTEYEAKVRADERNQWATHFEHILESSGHRTKYEEGFDDALNFVITEMEGEQE